MANNTFDITSNNSTLFFSVPGLIDTPVQIQGFSMDDIFSVAKVSPVETMMGLNGDLSGGFVYTEKTLELSLMAGSESNVFFDTWYEGMYSTTQALAMVGVLSVPSLGFTYSFTGFLKDYQPMSNAKKVMQPRTFGITVPNFIRAPIATTG